MDWKKDLKHLPFLKAENAFNLDPSKPVCDMPLLEAFIQSLLEEVAQKAIGNEYSKYRLDKEMKGVEQPHKTGLLGKRHGHNQKRQEVIDTFKKYGIIIK